MDRRAFITVVGGSFLAVPLATEAQQAAKTPRIGVLQQAESANNPIVLRVREAFRRGLREYGGYEEGRNITIEYRLGDMSQLRS